MNYLPRLQEIAEQVKKGEKPKETVRTLLSWFGVQRRGWSVSYDIRQEMKKLGLQTNPDFNIAYIDSLIQFVPYVEEKQNTDKNESTASISISERTPEGISDSPTIISITDPTYRIGKLASANNSPVSVKPDSSLSEATTIMLSHDFSQLPVMTNERDVKGVISWTSIGKRLVFEKPCTLVRDCMEPHQEISSDVSLFAAIDYIIHNEYVLIRDSTKKISGIVTTSDLSLQFLQLGEPFLLLGEIENQIRRLIHGKFSKDELSGARDPSDSARQISSEADLTFGEYIRLLENPARWSNLKIKIDRTVFIEKLDKVRQIRNDVMHFDPDGIAETDLKTLRDFVSFLQSLSKLGVI